MGNQQAAGPCAVESNNANIALIALSSVAVNELGRNDDNIAMTPLRTQQNPASHTSLDANSNRGDMYSVVRATNSNQSFIRDPRKSGSQVMGGETAMVIKHKGAMHATGYHARCETLTILNGDHQGSVRHELHPVSPNGHVLGDDESGASCSEDDSGEDVDWMQWQDTLSDLLNTDDSEYDPRSPSSDDDCAVDVEAGDPSSPLSQGSERLCPASTPRFFLRRVLNYLFSPTPSTPANTPRPTPGTTPQHSHHASTSEMHERLEHYANRYAAIHTRSLPYSLLHLE